MPTFKEIGVFMLSALLLLAAVAFLTHIGITEIKKHRRDGK